MNVKDTEEVNYLIKRLEYLRDCNRKSFIGLCGQVRCDNVWIDNRYEFFKSWEHFSGSLTYPVPITDSLFSTPSAQYNYSMDNRSLWIGKQLGLRLDLLDHLIKCFGELS